MENYAESRPRYTATVSKRRTYRDGTDYGYEFSVSRAHNTFTHTELTLADLYVLRGAITAGIQKIESGEL